MSEADRIVQRLLENDPTEFVDRQSDMLLLPALLKRKWKLRKPYQGYVRLNHYRDHDGYEEVVTIWIMRQHNGTTSVTATGEKNFADELQRDNWVDFEINKEWTLNPGEDVEEFIDSLEDDLSSFSGPDEEPIEEPDTDD